MSKSEAGRDDKRRDEVVRLRNRYINDEITGAEFVDSIMAIFAPSAGAATFAPEFAESLAGTASLLEDFARKVKEPPQNGYTHPRTISVAVWENCDAGGESVDEFTFDDGEAEAIAKMIRAALSAPSSEAPRSDHPEAHCERCRRPNVVWFAPSELWNQAVRAVNAPEILCPVCFVELAEAAGIKPTAWKVAPEEHRSSVAQSSEATRTIAFHALLQGEGEAYEGPASYAEALANEIEECFKVTSNESFCIRRADAESVIAALRAPSSGGTRMVPAETWEESNRCYLQQFDRAERLQKALDATQAELDRVMLEHCPDEMTEEQKANWAKHQRATAGHSAKDGSCR